MRGAALVAAAAFAAACSDVSGGSAGSMVDAAVDPPDAAPNVEPRPVRFTAYVDGVPANLPFVAASADGAAWQPVAGEDGVYALTAGRFGLFYVCEFMAGEMAGSATFFLHATADDFTSIARNCETGAAQEPTGTRVFGVVNGIGDGRTADIAMGRESGRSGITSGYGLRLPPGTWDMVVARDDGAITDQVIVRRDVAVGKDEVRQDFDFASEGVATAAIPVVVANRAPDEAAFVRSFFHLADGAVLFLLAEGENVSLVPEQLLTAGDVHEIDVVLRSADRVRSASTFVRAPGALDLTLLDPITASVSTASEAPLALRTVAGPDPSAGIYASRYVQTEGSRRELDVLFTAAAAGPGGLDHTAPMAELAALPGWNPAWELAAGVATGFSVSLRASDRPTSFDHDLDPAIPADLEGALGRASALEGTLVPSR